MSFSYDINLSDDISLVRLNVGDTNATKYYLEDETITALLVSSSVVQTSVSCCDIIIAKAATQVDESLEGHSKSFSQITKQYTDLKKILVAQLGTGVRYTPAAEVKFT